MLERQQFNQIYLYHKLDFAEGDQFNKWAVRNKLHFFPFDSWQGESFPCLISPDFSMYIDISLKNDSRAAAVLSFNPQQ
jgi:hypothetical protein